MTIYSLHHTPNLTRQRRPNVCALSLSNEERGIMWLDLKGLAVSHTRSHLLGLSSQCSFASFIPVPISISIPLTLFFFLRRTHFFIIFYVYVWFRLVRILFAILQFFLSLFKAKPHRDLEMRKIWISCIHLKRMLRSFTCLRALFVYAVCLCVCVCRNVCLSSLCVRVDHII